MTTAAQQTDHHLHERIAAAVAEKRQRVLTGEFDGKLTADDRLWILAACDHADKVLARHRRSTGEFHSGTEEWCRSDHATWPCPEISDLATMWLGPGWEQQT